MAYCNSTDLLTYISRMDLISFTDDGNTGNVDQTILDSIISNISSDIDGSLSSIYSTPFNPAPAAVKSACVSLVCYALYKRRLTPDESNPFTEDARNMRDRLVKIGNGTLELDCNFPRSFPQGAVVSEPSRVNASSL